MSLSKILETIEKNKIKYVPFFMSEFDFSEIKTHFLFRLKVVIIKYTYVGTKQTGNMYISENLTFHNIKGLKEYIAKNIDIIDFNHKETRIILEVQKEKHGFYYKKSENTYLVGSIFFQGIFRSIQKNKIELVDLLIKSLYEMNLVDIFLARFKEVK